MTLSWHPDKENEKTSGKVKKRKRKIRKIIVGKWKMRGKTNDNNVKKWDKFRNKISENIWNDENLDIITWEVV